MGTENKRFHNPVPLRIFQRVKLNNPLMGTENLRYIYIMHRREYNQLN